MRDDGAPFLTELRNGVLSHRTVTAPVQDVTLLTLSRRSSSACSLALSTLLRRWPTGLTIGGDPAVLAGLVGLLAPVDPDFAIVTPWQRSLAAHTGSPIRMALALAEP